MTLKVKEEIECPMKARFIKTARYVECLSNIVLVLKKNDKLRMCIDFQNLNSTTPKDEYPMLIADLLIDDATCLVFWMNIQAIMKYEKDVYKTTFGGVLILLGHSNG